MNINALIILADGFEEIEAITPIDILRRAHITVTVAGVENRTVTGSHGIEITADTTISEIDNNFDALILPGGPGTNILLESEKVLKLIKTVYSEKKLCAAICAAPKILAKAGILKSKNFTCFPAVTKDIHGGVHSADKVVITDNIITSKGAGTAVDFSLAIVEYLVDTSLADFISEEIIYKD